jgi:hypothetical protein
MAEPIISLSPPHSPPSTDFEPVETLYELVARIDSAPREIIPSPTRSHHRAGIIPGPSKEIGK